MKEYSIMLKQQEDKRNKEFEDKKNKLEKIANVYNGTTGQNLKEIERF